MPPVRLRWPDLATKGILQYQMSEMKHTKTGRQEVRAPLNPLSDNVWCHPLSDPGPAFDSQTQQVRAKKVSFASLMERSSWTDKWRGNLVAHYSGGPAQLTTIDG